MNVVKKTCTIDWNELMSLKELLSIQKGNTVLLHIKQGKVWSYEYVFFHFFIKMFAYNR